MPPLRRGSHSEMRPCWTAGPDLQNSKIRRASNRRDAAPLWPYPTPVPMPQKRCPQRAQETAVAARTTELAWRWKQMQTIGAARLSRLAHQKLLNGGRALCFTRPRKLSATRQFQLQRVGSSEKFALDSRSLPQYRQYTRARARGRS